MADLEQIPNIIASIRRRWNVSDDSLHQLAGMLQLRQVKKRCRLVREGAALGKAYFIEHGMTRSYWIVDGQEITTSFSTEGTLVFSMDELYFGNPSEEYVETVEPADVYEIGINDLRTLMSTNLEFANWSRVIHQVEYRRLHQSHKERLTLPARERFLAFAAIFPEVVRRARLTDIASYLGITLPTLSRIRAMIE